MCRARLRSFYGIKFLHSTSTVLSIDPYQILTTNTHRDPRDPNTNAPIGLSHYRRHRHQRRLPFPLTGSGYSAAKSACTRTGGMGALQTSWEARNRGGPLAPDCRIAAATSERPARLLGLGMALLSSGSYSLPCTSTYTQVLIPYGFCLAVGTDSESLLYLDRYLVR